MLTALAIAACRLVTFDIVTSERIVRVPQSSKDQFTIDTGTIELPASLGVDKTVDRATLDLTATNFNTENPVTVDLSIADSRDPNNFRPLVSFNLAAGEKRDLRLVESDPGNPLVRATQSESINIRFDSKSPTRGIGELEFRFKVRVVAHKKTPGTGAGVLLFY